MEAGIKLNVYDDVVNAGLIQPYKPVYGKADLRRLMKRYSDR